MSPEQLPIAGPILGAALTVVGLLISWVVWRRRGAAAGLRGVAWSLLPLAAGLMGLMSIIWRLAFDLAGFFVGLVFNPVVWAGIAVAGLAVVLWVVSGVLKSRGAGRSGSTGTAVEGADREPAAGISGPEAASGGAAQQPKKQAAGGTEDFSDIEDLLRKHGIE